MGYYGIDYTYLIFVLPAVLLALYAQIKVKSAYRRFSQRAVESGLTGADAAAAVLRLNGVSNVNIDAISGELTDNYDPRDNTIHLSAGVYGESSIAAVGIAAHEAGHAVQYAQGYAPVKLRTSIIGVTQIGSMLSWPLIFLGLIFNYKSLFLIGIIFFGAVCVFQLITLPVEFNASARAVTALDESGALASYELPEAKKMLSAAALTYVAALLVSLAQLLRLLLIFGGGSRRR